MMKLTILVMLLVYNVTASELKIFINHKSILRDTIHPVTMDSIVLLTQRNHDLTTITLSQWRLKWIELHSKKYQRSTKIPPDCLDGLGVWASLEFEDKLWEFTCFNFSKAYTTDDQIHLIKEFDQEFSEWLKALYNSFKLRN